MLEALRENVVLPAAHAQKDFSQQRRIMKMLGVDGGLPHRTERDLVTGHVVDNVKDGQSPVSGHRCLNIH
jgi:hypothetical protein